MLTDDTPGICAIRSTSRSPNRARASPGYCVWSRPNRGDHAVIEIEAHVGRARSESGCGRTAASPRPGTATSPADRRPAPVASTCAGSRSRRSVERHRPRPSASLCSAGSTPHTSVVSSTNGIAYGRTRLSSAIAFCSHAISDGNGIWFSDERHRQADHSSSSRRAADSRPASPARRARVRRQSPHEPQSRAAARSREP